MAEKTTCLMRTQDRRPFLSLVEISSYFGITSEYLQTLRDHVLVSTEIVNDQEQYPQEAIDQIHNIIVLERLFDIGPRALRPLYNLFKEQVFSLPVRDTDLYRYSNKELSTDARAEKDILSLTLKKIFLYLAALDGASKGGS
jgi:hypothetical protein